MKPRQSKWLRDTDKRTRGVEIVKCHHDDPLSFHMREGSPREHLVVLVQWCSLCGALKLHGPMRDGVWNHPGTRIDKGRIA
jgi:hypothetical protein